MKKATHLALGVLVLFAFLVGSDLLGLVCAASAASDSQSTKDIERAWLLKQALPGADRFESRDEGGTQYEIAYRGEEVMGGVFYTDGVGYGGVMRFMVGLDPEGKVVEIVLVSHRESKGLGSKVDDPVFLSQFRGRGGPFVLKRDHPSGNIDGVAGATLSSRGVVMAVEEAVKAFHRVWKAEEGTPPIPPAKEEE